MMRAILFCILLTGCLSNRVLQIGEGQDLSHNLSVTKQKQRITFLQKKLEIAEKDLKNAQDEVESLQSQIHRSQLALIVKLIENYEHQIGKNKEGTRILSKSDVKTLSFLKEREMLQKMMEQGPSPEAFEAQVVLDRMLRMITELRDTERG
jgi:hypothetical protein